MNATANWVPTEQQLRVLQDEHLRVMLIAGNRFGKTTLGMRRVLHCARGNYPWAPVRDGRTYWVLCPTEKSFEEVHWPIFNQWCPPDWLIHWNQSRMRATIRRVDGGQSTITWWTYEQKSTSLIGASLSGCWLDEPPPRPHYQELHTRLVDQGGWMWMTMTPVEGIGWWGEEIYEPAKAGKKEWSLHQCALATRDEHNEKEYWVGKPLVSHLTRQQIVDFASGFPDEDDLAIRIFGEVRSRRGLVYKDFDPALHLVEDIEVPREWDIWGAVDPGYHGFAVVLGGVTPTSEVVVVREYFSQGEAMATRFAEVERLVRGLRNDVTDWEFQYGSQGSDHVVAEAEQMHEGADVTVVLYVDTEDPQTVLEMNNASLASVAEQRARGEELVIGLCFTPIEQGLKAVKAGILRVQRLLHPQPGRNVPKGLTAAPVEELPRLYLFEGMQSEWRTGEQRQKRGRLRWEFDNYEWKQPAKGSLLKRDEPNKESAGGAHMLDALRYLVMSRVGPRLDSGRIDTDRGLFDIGQPVSMAELAREEDVKAIRHMFDKVRAARGV